MENSSYSRESSSTFQKPTGKYSSHSNRNLFQQVVRNDFNEHIKACSSNSKRFIYRRSSYHSTSSEADSLQQGVENFNIGSGDFVNCKRVQISLSLDSIPDQNPSPSTFNKTTSTCNRKRNAGFVKERLIRIRMVEDTLGEFLSNM